MDFDAKLNFWDVVDVWSRTDSPNAQAYQLLEDLDLGPDLTGKDAVGEINYIDGSCPGNDYLGVEAAHQDSISLLPVLLGKSSPSREAIFIQGDGKDEAIAICSGRWKLIVRESLSFELYDLSIDPGEATDISSKNAAVVKRLASALEKAETAGKTRL